MSRGRRLLFLLAQLAAGLLAVSPARSAERVVLSGEETAWIAGHPEVSVGFSESFPPYSQPGPDGVLTGMDIDYLNLIAARTGLKFRTVIFKNWADAETEFKTGHIQMLTGLVHTPAREAYTIFPRPYMFAPDVIITRTDMPYVLDAAQLQDLQVGAVRGVPNEQWDRLRRTAPDHVREFDSMNPVFVALSRGTIDATVSDTVNAAYTIKSLHLSNLRLGSVFGGSGSSYLGVTRREPVLAGIIDKALATVTTQDRRAIDERWIALDLAPSKWLFAFKIAASFAAAALAVFLLVVLHNRRLAAELAERRRIQLELETTHAQLARVSEEKSELLRMVAHDLRSPLTGFLLGADLLHGELDPANQTAHETLGRMRTSTRQMMRLTNDLVDVHLLEAGKRDYRSAEVDFSALLHEAVAAYSERAAHKKIRLRLQVGPPGKPLWSDASALRQVTDNLISNALKYSPPDSEVTVALVGTAENYRLTVTDQGPGIGEADRHRLFQKYVRGAAQPTGGETSTGLGLWIVHRFVTALHGRVWHEPGPGGRGSVFVLELPLSGPAAP